MNQKGKCPPGRFPRSFGYATNIETLVRDNKHGWFGRIQKSDLKEPIPLLNQGATLTKYTLENSLGG